MFLFLCPVRTECKGVRIYKVRYDGHFIRVTDVCAQAPFQFRADTDDLAASLYAFFSITACDGVV